MAGYVILGTMAAIGALSVLWALFGWLLPGGEEAAVVFPVRPGDGELSPAGRYLWLRSLGLLNCPLVAVDLGLSDRERQWLEDQKIEICSPAELAAGLGIGAKSN